MKHVEVASSNILSVGHDAATNTLEVRFIRGGLYRYPGVGYDLYQELLRSQSKGKFLKGQISPQFPRVTEE